MSRRASTIEWIVAENDSDWERLCASLTPDIAPKLAPAAHNRSSSKRFTGSIVVLVLALALGSGWWWRAAQAKLPKNEAEMGAIAQRRSTKLNARGGNGTRGRAGRADAR